MHKRSILRRPLLTEKIAAQQDTNNQYAFEVDRKANKVEIQRAIELKYDVTVIDIQTMNVRGKVKRLGRFEGKRADWKKAIVRLKTGDSIELATHT
ncbi:50S ribosomal protein L23 [bacterium]|nr:50S ribosomal protein L23 [bacterium]RQV99571.1 MAG: 50S ribosomal protein L23 [bacterium]